jgi:multiple sugar transport system ATP-binding protein
MGEIQQIGTPQEIYDFPQNEFVATFIGSPQMNIFKECNACSVNDSTYSFSIIGQSYSIQPFESINFPVKLDIGVRPEDIVLTEDDNGKIHIAHKEFLGDVYVYHCEVKKEEEHLSFCVKSKKEYRIDKRYEIKFEKLHVFDAISKKRIQFNE